MNAQQLKNSILQMAVQGKLVPQDPNDEPASVLLERIRKEKEKLIKAGKIKREKNPSVIFRGSDNLPYEKIGKETRCIADEIPFEIPESWGWTRLGSIGEWGAGATPNRTQPEYYKNATIPWLKTGDLTDGYITTIPEFISQKALTETSVRLNPTGAVLIAMYGATIGKLGILTFPATTNQACCACLPIHGIENKFLFYFLMAKKVSFIQQGEGGAQPNISKEKIVATLMQVPPLAEQKRIVAKIEELLPHLEDYDRAETRVTKLNAEFPEQLKKSILQWAIQGKLVPQDPADEPTSVLLERIRAEKAKLVKAGKIKKDKNESVIFRRDNSHYEKLNGVERCIDDEIPFEIPDSWEWVCLEQICIYIQRGKSPKYSLIKKYPVIAQKCNQWTGFSIEKAQFIAPETISSYSEERFMQDRDLLWNSTGLGTLGRMAIYRTELNPYGIAVADSHVTVIRPCSLVLPEFLFYYFANPTVQTVIEEQSDGSTKQKELSRNTVRAYWVPLPPLAEQKRIVAEIEMLFSLQRTMRHS